MSSKNNDGCGMIIFIACIVGFFISIITTIKKNSSDSYSDILFVFVILAGIGYFIYSVTKKN